MSVPPVTTVLPLYVQVPSKFNVPDPCLLNGELAAPVFCRTVVVMFNTLLEPELKKQLAVRSPKPPGPVIQLVVFAEVEIEVAKKFHACVPPVEVSVPPASVSGRLPKVSDWFVKVFFKTP